MPKKAKHPCRHPGCPNLTDDKYCEEHKHLYPDRPSSSSRGYGTKWQKASKAFLRKHPLCAACQADGRYTLATVVDHITPHRGDKSLFWNQNNWQPLCKPCHDRKTWLEDSNPEYHY
ncbi:MAG: HNH endonuclease [Oscillospiraceae bacterium]|nr:HNH endonuclease [Oscillospiraceae bacterium]